MEIKEVHEGQRLVTRREAPTHWPYRSRPEGLVGLPVKVNSGRRIEEVIAIACYCRFLTRIVKLREPTAS